MGRNKIISTESRNLSLTLLHSGNAMTVGVLLRRSGLIVSHLSGDSLAAWKSVIVRKNFRLTIRFATHGLRHDTSRDHCNVCNQK